MFALVTTVLGSGMNRSGILPFQASNIDSTVSFNSV